MCDAPFSFPASPLLGRVLVAGAGRRRSLPGRAVRWLRRLAPTLTASRAERRSSVSELASVVLAHLNGEVAMPPIDNIGRIEGFTGWRVHVRTSAGTFDLPYLSTYRPQLGEMVTIVDGVVIGAVTAAPAPADPDASAQT